MQHPIAHPWSEQYLSLKIDAQDQALFQKHTMVNDKLIKSNKIKSMGTVLQDPPGHAE